jgi:hypothetical protein
MGLRSWIVNRESWIANRVFSIRDPRSTIHDLRRVEEAERHRFAALQANCATDPAGPQAGRRGQSQFVGNANLHFVDAITRTTRFAGSIERHKLEVDAVIVQEAK